MDAATVSSAACWVRVEWAAQPLASSAAARATLTTFLLMVDS
jgi:hypothetical protein